VTAAPARDGGATRDYGRTHRERDRGRGRASRWHVIVAAGARAESACLWHRKGTGSMAEIDMSKRIADVVIVHPSAHGDRRGRFVETYRRSWFPQGREMIQSNRSDKAAGAVVGLHYHLHQADYWYVTSGLARMVMVDLRLGSPTEGAVLETELGGDEERGVFVPPGVAHGFASLSELTLTYLVDSYYNPSDELGLAFDDPTLGLDWGITEPIVSDRDRSNPRRVDIPDHLVPRYGSRA
jgi:dTDP-4-dehydrorhamnose 3,5-epimerase